MNKLFILLIFLNANFAMQSPDVKLYAQDFGKLGVAYTTQLVIDGAIDRSRILEPMPNYEAVSVITRLTHAVRTGYQAPLCLKYLSARLGYGVFTDAPIEKNDIVGEYTGDLMTYDKLLTIPKDKSNYIVPMVCYAGYYMPEALYIDAHSKGNFTRFINHSHKANVIAKMVYVDSLWHIILVASDTVPYNSQLFLDYGPDYWYAKGIEPEELN